jgi:Phospholipase_D-nuclease N-terminal
MGTGIFGLLLLILDIYVIYRILMSGSSTGAKVLWIILVLFLPLVGPILWFLLGRG